MVAHDQPFLLFLRIEIFFGGLFWSAGNELPAREDIVGEAHRGARDGEELEGAADGRVVERENLLGFGGATLNRGNRHVGCERKRAEEGSYSRGYPWADAMTNFSRLLEFEEEVSHV